jgi:acyl-CoA hydrolase
MRVINESQLARILSNLPMKNPRVVAGGNFGTPMGLLRLFDKNVPEFKLHMINAQKGLPDRTGITWETAFVGPGMRPRVGQTGSNFEYIPCRLSLLPLLYRKHYQPDIVVIQTSAIQRHSVSMGIEVNILPSAIRAVKMNGGLVIAQANRNMPYTFGDGILYEKDIDYVVEIDEPLIELPVPKQIDDETKAIGDQIANRVQDGSALQMGIGAIPDAVLNRLISTPGKFQKMRIWTEMMSDGVLRMEQAQALDKDVSIVTSFAGGTKVLYEWMDNNSRLRVLRTERTNDPGQIEKQPAMTSINSAIQIDLFDQANASFKNGQIYSGIGGSTDFIVGALHSPGGASFMALHSWHPKAKVSTIIPKLTENVSSFQHSFVVTENGCAEIFGCSKRDQALNLIEQAAHPSVRQSLTNAAHEMKIF